MSNGIPQTAMNKVIIEICKLPAEGTPKTLPQAIQHSLSVGPLSEIQERTYLVIKDFIANQLQTFMFKANSDYEQQLISNIFEALTKR